MNEKEARRNTTEALIQSRQSDYDRWSDNRSLMPAWNDRTKLIANLIPHNTSVFEFGAGAGVLQQYLPPGTNYQKSDLVDRDGKTVVIDLNAEKIEPIVGYETAVFSGVLEYIHDLPRLAEFLTQHFNALVFSYASLDKNTNERRSHGWVNDLTSSELISIFKKAGFNLIDYRTWKTQTIFCLIKRKGNANTALSEIEHTFAISLDGEAERHHHIAAEMSAFGLTDLSVYSATNYNDEKVKTAFKRGLIQKPGQCFRCGNDACQCPNNVLIPKQVGNWLSFLSVLHVIKLAQYSVAMICEDDVKFTYYASSAFRAIKENHELINKLHSSEPVLIRLGYPGYTTDIHKYEGKFSFTQHKQMSNSCFICNAAYAEHVIDSINAEGIIKHTSDVYFHDLCLSDSVKSYTVAPPPAFDLSQSRLMYSTIHPKNIDQLDRNRDRTHVKRVFNYVGFAEVFGGNFGDVLGSYIYTKIVGVTPNAIHINNQEVKRNNRLEHYLIVGSILKHATKKANLWGIGIMHPGDEAKLEDSLVSEQIYALRGPRTKQALENNGVRLLDNIALGDPAILLPLLHAGSEEKNFTFGIVPHYTEYEIVKERYKGHPNVTVICLGNHSSDECIENTIDTMTRCERILSSSLHGIIVAHAYGIPAVWCNFSEITLNQKSGTTALKFHDYFESLQLVGIEPVLCVSDNAEFPRESQFILPKTSDIENMQSELLRFCPFNVLGLDREGLKNRVPEGSVEQEQPFSSLLGLE